MEPTYTLHASHTITDPTTVCVVNLEAVSRYEWGISYTVCWYVLAGQHAEPLIAQGANIRVSHQPCWSWEHCLMYIITLWFYTLHNNVVKYPLCGNVIVYVCWGITAAC